MANQNLSATGALFTTNRQLKPESLAVVGGKFEDAV
uniref:Uncharacterized protein n=1 Tax=mine drainage metagenome TaxID=410659 RepID=E6QNC0_9ZZZZ